MFVGFVGFIDTCSHLNFRPARPVLRDEAGGHVSPGPDPPAGWRAGLVIPDSTKINPPQAGKQDWRYIISKRIFKSRRTRAGSLLTLGT